MKADEGDPPSLPCQNFFDLLQVVDIVPGKHADTVLDRFLATLGVHSIMLPLLGRQGFEQCEIGFPERAKCSRDFRGSRFS